MPRKRSLTQSTDEPYTTFIKTNLQAAEAEKLWEETCAFLETMGWSIALDALFPDQWRLTLKSATATTSILINRQLLRDWRTQHGEDPNGFGSNSSNKAWLDALTAYLLDLYLRLSDPETYIRTNLITATLPQDNQSPPLP